MSIEEEIFQIYNEIKKLQQKIGDSEDTIEVYSKKIFDLKVKLQRLEKNLYLRVNPDIESETIDLYLSNVHEKIEKNLIILNTLLHYMVLRLKLVK